MTNNVLLTKPQQAVIDDLEYWLKLAREGEVAGLAMVVQKGIDGSNSSMRWSTAGVLNAYAAVGAMEHAKTYLLSLTTS